VTHGSPRDRQDDRASRLLVLVMATFLPVCAAADPYSDTFQPDVFGTRAALTGRTNGLQDPWGKLCALPTEPLSLAAAIDLALCRNPAMRTSWVAAHRQAAALGSAESSLLPTISATGSAARSLGAHEDANGTITALDQTTKDAAVDMSWTLYDFGARSGRIQSARRLLDAAAFSINSVSQQTILSVVQSYYGVVAAEDSLVAAQTTESTAQHSLEIARSLQENGLESLADVLQAETAYDQDVLAREQAELAVTAARGALAAVMGLNADQPLKLAAEPVPTQVPELTARLEDLMAEAAKQRPDLAAARAQRDSAIAEVGVARAVGWPVVSIEGGRTTVKQTEVPAQNFWQVGIHVTVPVFTGFSVAYGVRQAQAALESSEVSAEQVRLNVTLDVWSAYHGLDSSIKQLATTATLLSAAQSNADVALGRYQAGLGNILDLLTAQNAANAARERRITAELNWQLSRARLVFAVGKLTGVAPLDTDTP